MARKKKEQEVITSVANSSSPVKIDKSFIEISKEKIGMMLN